MNSPGENPTPPPPSPPPRILVVEDNEDNRDIIVRRLVRRGFAVTTAPNGFEGLRRAVQELPDLILLDLEMPAMDGYEVLRQLRAHRPTEKIPVIVLTAHVLEDHAAAAYQAGADNFESKPIDFPRLIGKMLLYLHGVAPGWRLPGGQGIDEQPN